MMSPTVGRTLLIFSLAVMFPVGLPSLAWAQATPAYAFEKPPEKPVEWKVQSKGGFVMTSGNSRSTSGTLSLDASRQKNNDKVSLNAGLAYGKSTLRDPVITPGVPPAGNTVTGFTDRDETTTNQWRAKGRYDRFLTPNNAIYGLGQIGADRIAGKRLFGGGQLGYSRQLYKSGMHTAVAEAGYDFSYESYVQIPGKTLDAVAIHSARLFVGELLTLTKDTGLSGSVEALFNLNKEKALDASDSTGQTSGVGAFKDTRLIGKLGITTLLRSSLSFGFGFTVRYDQNPAPRPLPASAAGATYAAGFQPFSDKVDTLTEATLIYTFL